MKTVDGSGKNDYNNMKSDFNNHHEVTSTNKCSFSDAKNRRKVQCNKGALQQVSNILSQNINLEHFDIKGNLPIIPINDLRGEESSLYSREECILRRSLAALYRLIDIRGWTQSIYNHISARCPADRTHFLINPFGLLYHEIQASSLVKIDHSGNVIEHGSSVLGCNKAGWILHYALHSAREDVNCVIHVHLPDVIAVSCLRAGLLPVSAEAVDLITNIGVCYHDYQGIIVKDLEVSSIQKDLGLKAKVLFLRNHGVVVAAVNIAEAWFILKRVIIACQTQMRLMQLSGGASLLSELKESASHLVNGSGFNNVLNGNGFLNDKHDSVLIHDERDDIDGSMWLPEQLEFEAEMRVLDSAGFRTGHIYKQPNLLRRTCPVSGWTGDTMGDQMTSVDLFTTDFSTAEYGTVEDIAEAEAAGAEQISKIVDHIKTNKQKSLQRNQWLTATDETPGAKLVTSSMVVSPNTDKVCFGNDKLCPFDSPIGTPLSHLKHSGFYSNQATDKRLVQNGSGNNSLNLGELKNHTVSNKYKKSATLPSEVPSINQVHLNNSNLTEEGNICGEDIVRTDKKVKKRSSFRMPSFSRKKKH